MCVWRGKSWGGGGRRVTNSVLTWAWAILSRPVQPQFFTPVSITTSDDASKSECNDSLRMQNRRENLSSLARNITAIHPEYGGHLSQTGSLSAAWRRQFRLSTPFSPLLVTRSPVKSTMIANCHNPVRKYERLSQTRCETPPRAIS